MYHKDESCSTCLPMPSLFYLAYCPQYLSKLLDMTEVSSFFENSHWLLFLGIAIVNICAAFMSYVNVIYM